MFKKTFFKVYLFLAFFLVHDAIYSQPFKTAQELKDYFKANILTLKKYEGIYKFTETLLQKDRYGNISNRPWSTVAPKRSLLYKSGIYEQCDEYGDCKWIAHFEQTADTNILRFVWSVGTIKCVAKNGDCIECMEDWFWNDKTRVYEALKSIYLKLYPTQYDVEEAINNSPQNKSRISGTGFAVSSNGYVITNYHVIEEGNSIHVKGVNGNFNKSFIANVVVSDKANDLALLKITDVNFTSAGVIPYTFSIKNAQVGHNVFVLGYPLRATMGDEVKLTNGIISANSGFEGGINQYQISVPVQPGNSGGPLINSNGNIVGVVNAKHLGTDNVSYAIKGSLLTNLFESSMEQISLPQTNLLIGKSLSEQVQLAKKFVYIIEVE